VEPVALITIPFTSVTANAALTGRKCLTARLKRMGDPGDEFKINGVWFSLIDVHTAPLRWVRDSAYRLGGAETPAQFELVWRANHRGHFSADGGCHLHYFGRAAAGETPMRFDPASVLMVEGPDAAVPFSGAMAHAALTGRKCLSGQFERMGEPGGEFAIAGVWFRLIDVQTTPLWWVRDRAFRLEGTESPAAFERHWRSLHEGRFLGDRECYLHYFGRSPGD
jgi:hypothetical protein